MYQLRFLLAATLLGAPAFAQERANARHEGHMRPRQDGKSDGVDIFLQSGRHDHIGRLAPACVDDFEAFVA